MDKAKSVLARLKSKSKTTGNSMQLLLQLLCQEEILRRISKTTYKDNLVLKGGLFIYMLTDFESRATIDMDFLLRNINNTSENVLEVIKEILEADTGNDFITFDILGSEKIALEKKYSGISVKLTGKVSNTKTPIHIDFGVGDVIVPKSEVCKIKTQLDDFEEVSVTTYSLESTIAEKFDAILQRFELTSRMKDFYDIFYLASVFDFEGETLYEAIYNTLQNRGTVLETDSFDRIENLKSNDIILARWKLFQKKYSIDIEFNDVEELLKTFLGELIDRMVTNDGFEGHWVSKGLSW
jgi:predicted nucleotidyltransferase component of viral defense system